MKNKARMKFDFSNFESVTEDSENKLIGGFSASVSGVESQEPDNITNNCQGANCYTGCGKGQTVNGVAGCGTR